MTSNPYNVNVDLMRRWIADLRTTTAPQCKGVLLKDHGGEARFCCLGRMVAVQYGEPVTERTGRGAFPGLSLQFPGAAARLTPLALLTAGAASRLLSEEKNYGLSDEVIFPTDPDQAVDDAYDVILATPGDEFWPAEALAAVGLLTGNGGEQANRLAASAANDNLGWSFAKIADALEARYLPEDWAATKKTRETGKGATW